MVVGDENGHCTVSIEVFHSVGNMVCSTYNYKQQNDRSCGPGDILMEKQAEEALYREALRMHARGKPGKIEIRATKPLTTQRDLTLAYSPGVAAPCLEIFENPDKVYDYTARGNMVAVISNGTAVLGLGNIGPLAGKPVMEGKCVLFKRFADVDAVNVEVFTEDVDEFVESVRLFGETFGGINLEDIKAPECFMIEEDELSF